MRKYVVTLTAEERDQLQALIRAGRASALKLARARALLKADAAPGGPDWPAGWSSCGWWTRSPTRPCGGRSKKRAEAVAEAAVVHPAAGERRVRGPDGGRLGRLPP